MGKRREAAGHAARARHPSGDARLDAGRGGQARQIAVPQRAGRRHRQSLSASSRRTSGRRSRPRRTSRPTTKWSRVEGPARSRKAAASTSREAVDWTCDAGTRRARQPGRCGGSCRCSREDAMPPPTSCPYLQARADRARAVSLADVQADGVGHRAHAHARTRNSCAWPLPRCSASRIDERRHPHLPGSGHFGRSNGGNAGSEDEAVLLSRAIGRTGARAVDAGRRHAVVDAVVGDRCRQIRIASRRATAGSSGLSEPITSGRRCRTTGRSVRCSRVCRPSRRRQPDNPSGVHQRDSWVVAIPGSTRRCRTSPKPGTARSRSASSESPIARRPARSLDAHADPVPAELPARNGDQRGGSAGRRRTRSSSASITLTKRRFKDILTRLRDESGWQTRPSPSPDATREGDRRSRAVEASRSCSATTATGPAPPRGCHAVHRASSRSSALTLVVDPGVVVNPLQFKRQVRSRLPDGRQPARSTRKSRSTKAPSRRQLG